MYVLGDSPAGRGDELEFVAVQRVTIPVAAGRNLAVLTEAAVRNYVLQLRGIDSTREFIERQARQMKSEEDNSG